MSYLKKQKGFTLIELMVSVLIIAILSGVTLSVLNIRQIQARARDSQRIGDMKKIQTALELYFSDNRRYPIHPNYTEIASVTLTNYINKKPVDPKLGATSVNKDGTPVYCATNISTHGYYYRTDATTGSSYVILSAMEVQSSATGNLSSSLFNCTTTPPKISCNVTVADTHCYGVENPL